MFFPVLTKNSNWEILHKNLVNLGGLPKKEGGLNSLLIRGGGEGLGKKEGVVFLRGRVDTPMHTMFGFI